MKTTSILTLTATLSVVSLSVLKFNQQEPKATDRQAITRTVQMPLDHEDIFLDLFVEKQGKTTLAANKQAAPSSTVEKNGCDHEGASTTQDLCLDAIVFIEEQDQVDLGFDVDAYLPADFDPYAPAVKEPDLSTITYIEADEFDGLGFDTAEYLPLGFNPYAGMEANLDEIVFLEPEEPILLGFDTRDYLPEGFNPYARPELNLDEIPYMEMEETLDLGFDVNTYLPADFNPYAAPEFNLDQIIFIEEEEEIDFWKANELPSSEAVYNF